MTPTAPVGAEINIAPYLAFLLAGLVGLGIAAMTFLLAKRSGLQPVQNQLIQTLKDNVDAQDDKIDRLEEEVKAAQAARIADKEVAEKARLALEARVEQLQATVIYLAAENADLRRRLGMPSTNGGDPNAPV